MMEQFWSTGFEASGFACRKQLPASKLYSPLLHLPVSLLFPHLPHLQPLSLPWFIHTARLQTLTWRLYSLLSSSLRVILSLSLYYSLYLSAPLPPCLLLSLSNWYAISWSSDIAVTFCLHASTQAVQVVSPFPLDTLASSVCVLSVSPPYINKTW